MNKEDHMYIERITNGLRSYISPLDIHTKEELFNIIQKAIKNSDYNRDQKCNMRRLFRIMKKQNMSWFQPGSDAVKLLRDAIRAYYRSDLI